MNFFVYLIVTKTKERLISYVGYTINLEKRINLHNSGKGAKFTRGRFWVLLYYKKYKSKKKALSEEYKLKKDFKLRKKIKQSY
tara:strand:- start:1833 stop:2081 length:249 start_codon:yes stop_codon:yes gene_type:complete